MLRRSSSFRRASGAVWPDPRRRRAGSESIRCCPNRLPAGNSCLRFERPGYVAAATLAAALVLAPLVPLWQTWFGNVAAFRGYVVERTSTLTELFQREGPVAVAAAVRSEAGALPDGRIILFADPGKKVLAGTLRVWPAAVPDVPVMGLPLSFDPGAIK